MSAEITNARKKLKTIRSLLKKNKYMPAGTAIYDALLVVLKNSLMGAESREFSLLFQEAVSALNNDRELRKLYPLVLSYNPGDERSLLDQVKEMLAELQKAIDEEARNKLKAIEAKKTEVADKGQQHLDNEEWDEAAKVFNEALAEFGDDSDFKTNIADRYLKAGRYEEALILLEAALRDDPNAIHLYNRVGMALRKLKRFDTAEQYYTKALTLASNDEYLYYNLGRLYYDSHQWDKMLDASEKAVAINPDFEQAVKMLKFAKKKTGV